MLAIVEDNEGVAAAEEIVQTRDVIDSERGSGGGFDVRGIGNGRELDQPTAVQFRVSNSTRGLEREAGLSRAARSHQGDEPMTAQQLTHLLELFLPTDE